MAYTYSKIASYTVGSGGIGEVNFLAIPQNYTNLIIKTTLRHSATGAANGKINFNGTTTGYSERVLYVSGTTVSAANQSTTSFAWATIMYGSDVTANCFSSSDIYIPNYAGSDYKSIATESVAEQNGSPVNVWVDAGLWSNIAPINSITFTPSSGSFVQNCTFTLYGIKAEV
jgi:hypothetical protein